MHSLDRARRPGAAKTKTAVSSEEFIIISQPHKASAEAQPAKKEISLLLFLYMEVFSKMQKTCALQRTTCKCAAPVECSHSYCLMVGPICYIQSYKNVDLQAKVQYPCCDFNTRVKEKLQRQLTMTSLVS